MSTTEIIDLTTPSPTPSPSYNSDVVSESTQLNDRSLAEEKRRKRKRKGKKSPQPSRRGSVEPSAEFQNAKRQRNGLDYANLDEAGIKDKTEGKKHDIATDNDQDLFFVDITPAPTLSSHQNVAGLPTDSLEASSKLLVPSHVTVLGSTPVEIIAQPLSDSEDEDFVDYLEYDDPKHTARYFDAVPDETTPSTRTVCKNCGAEGLHKTSACPVQICLTCGVRDEHSTRSCPISKICFTCGMKGHINATCPNRRSARALLASQESECDRCSSSRHKTNECPTLWRLYEYLTGEERLSTMSLRQSRKDLLLGQDGEGYIADDEWCYNCGSYGHWGDDCHDLSNDKFSSEYSAFSNYNVMNGPFYDSVKESKPSALRQHPSERVDSISGWENEALINVGKRGRMKSKAALAKQAERIVDDPDDWFSNSSKRMGNPNLPKKPENKKLSFGRNLRETRYEEPVKSRQPSLRDRLGDVKYDSNNNNRSNRSHHRDYNNSSRKDNYDTNGSRWDEPSYSERSDRRRSSYTNGPRYYGGYGGYGR